MSDCFEGLIEALES